MLRALSRRHQGLGKLSAFLGAAPGTLTEEDERMDAMNLESCQARVVELSTRDWQRDNSYIRAVGMPDPGSSSRTPGPSHDRACAWYGWRSIVGNGAKFPME